MERVYSYNPEACTGQVLTGQTETIKWYKQHTNMTMSMAMVFTLLKVLQMYNYTNKKSIH